MCEECIDKTNARYPQCYGCRYSIHNNPCPRMLEYGPCRDGSEFKPATYLRDWIEQTKQRSE